MTRLFRVALFVALGLVSAAPLSAQAPQIAADEDPLPPDALMRLGTTHWRCIGTPVCAAFSPDGKLFAIIGGDGVLRLWDAASGRELHAFGKEQARCLAFSPDSKYLAVSGWGGKRALLIDVATCQVVREFTDTDSPYLQVYSLTFSPDGRTLVTGTLGSTALERRGNVTPEQKCVVQRWDVATGKQLWRATLLPYPVVHLAFAPGGKSLAVGTQTHLLVLDADTGKERHRREWLYGPFNFDAEGTTLWYRRYDKNDVTYYEQLDAKTGKVLTAHRVPRGGAVAGPDGKLLVVPRKGPRDLWDAVAGKKLCTLAGLPEPNFDSSNYPGVQPLALTPDGNTLAAAVGRLNYSEATVRLFDVATGQERRAPVGHREGVTRLTVSADGKALASAGPDATVCLWDLGSGKLLRRLEHPHRRVAVSLSPDGRLLAGAAGKWVILWHTATGQEHRRWECPEARQAPGGALSHALFTKDGKTLVLGMGYAWATAWNVPEGKRLSLFKGAYASNLADMDLSPDGRLAALTASNGACLWDVTTGKLVGETKSSGGFQAVAFSPDGKTLALAYYGQVQITDLETLKTGKEARSFHVEGAVTALAFSPDGKTLATGIGWAHVPGQGLPQNLVQLWDVATGKERRRFAGHRHEVKAVAFTPDGSAVVSGSVDNTILVWSVRGTGKAEKQ